MSEERKFILFYSQIEVSLTSLFINKVGAGQTGAAVSADLAVLWPTSVSVCLESCRKDRLAPKWSIKWNSAVYILRK